MCISEEGSRVLIPQKTNPLDIISVTTGVTLPESSVSSKKMTKMNLDIFYLPFDI